VERADYASRAIKALDVWPQRPTRPGCPLTGAPALGRLAYEVEVLATFAGTSTAAFVSIGALSLAIWRKHLLPKWLALFGLVAMAANMVELVGLGSRTGAVAGGQADGVGALLWVLWVAAASICMSRRTGPSHVV